MALIEIAWRWSFAAIFILLMLLCIGKYLQGLPVSESQMLLIGSGQSALVLRTLQEIFKGSGPRFLAALTIFAFSTTVAWILFASFGRTSTLNVLLRQGDQNNRTSVAPILRLNILRALSVITIILISAVAFIMLGSLQGNSADSIAPLLALLLVAGIWFCWTVVNWLLSIAPVFVAKEECRAYAAIGRAIDLCQNKLGGLIVIGLWFGILRFVVFFLMGMFVLVLVALAPADSAALTAAMIAASLGYFFLADFLYAGRLAAYFSLANPPTAILEAAPIPESLQTGGAVDPSELILSDLSGLA